MPVIHESHPWKSSIKSIKVIHGWCPWQSSMTIHDSPCQPDRDCKPFSAWFYEIAFVKNEKLFSFIQFISYILEILLNSKAENASIEKKSTEVTSLTSRWKKVNNTIIFINISKKCAKNSLSNNPQLNKPRRRSRWTIVRIAFSVINFFLRKTKNLSNPIKDQKVLFFINKPNNVLEIKTKDKRITEKFNFFL